MRLQVYIEEGCTGCATARSIAAAVAERFPMHTVEVIDIARATDPIPAAVFAVPTYLIDGRVAYLGNPRLEEILGKLVAPE